VVANGDLISTEDRATMISQTGCDALMAGRGAYGRPWLPGYLASHDPGAFLAALPTPLDLISEHYEMLVEHHAIHKGRPLGVRIARKHFGWYLDTTQRPLTTDPTDLQTLMRSDDANAVRCAIGKVWRDAAWLKPIGREGRASVGDRDPFESVGIAPQTPRSAHAA
jgi:tRNA-dihydrouridine synthase